MKLSRSTEYALTALDYMVHHAPGEPITARTIAQHQRVPLGYLLKIMQQLVRANILLSSRGPQGGFTLARPPGDITLLEIIQAIEGPILASPGPAASELSFSPDRLHAALNQSATAAADVLRATRLSDILE